MNTTPNYATLREAAARLQCHERTVRRYIDQGMLTGYRIGPRQIRVDLNQIDALFTVIPEVEVKS